MFSLKVFALLLILGSVEVAIGVSDRKLSHILQSYIQLSFEKAGLSSFEKL